MQSYNQHAHTLRSVTSVPNSVFSALKSVSLSFNCKADTEYYHLQGAIAHAQCKFRSHQAHSSNGVFLDSACLASFPYSLFAPVRSWHAEELPGPF
jgi:hypothetical protein